jgi:hypothetical protein
MPTAAYRAYFIVVGLFALWVGAWGFVVPGEIGRALPWTIPPLHARFIAAIYLAGLLAMVWSALARSVAEVRIPIALAALWTGALLAVSMLQLPAFDFAKPQVWFWMGAYAAFPLWGAWLYFGAGAGRTAERRAADPALVAVGCVCIALAAAMLIAPALVIRAWPWTLPPLLASIYAGPFLAYGVASLMLAREARTASRRIVLASLLAFTVLVLVASLLHLKLFRFDGPASWVWFGTALAGSALLLMRLSQARRA